MVSRFSCYVVKTVLWLCMIQLREHDKNDCGHVRVSAVCSGKSQPKQLRFLARDLGLTAICRDQSCHAHFEWAMRKRECAGMAGFAEKKDAHWSVSYSLTSHHRAATIKQSRGFMSSRWSALVWLMWNRTSRHFTSNLLTISSSNRWISVIHNTWNTNTSRLSDILSEIISWYQVIEGRFNIYIAVRVQFVLVLLLTLVSFIRGAL